MDADEISVKTEIREYAEEMEVEVRERKGRLIIKAWNEGGFNSTETDLQDAIDWVCKNEPWIFCDSTPPHIPQGKTRESAWHEYLKAATQMISVIRGIPCGFPDQEAIEFAQGEISVLSVEMRCALERYKNGGG